MTASTFPGLTVIRQSALNIDIITDVWISVYGVELKRSDDLHILYDQNKC